MVVVLWYWEEVIDVKDFGKDLKAKELVSLLRENGYSFASSFSDYSWHKLTRSSEYVRSTNTIDLPISLATVEKALSEIGPYSLRLGIYWATITETLNRDGARDERFSYRYLYLLCSKGTSLPVEAAISISGKLSAPFPFGEVESLYLEADLYIGPIPVGRGQARRSEEVVRYTILSIPSFVEAFPNADVFAVWETRGGRGGVMAKTANRYLGKAEAVASLYW